MKYFILSFFAIIAFSCTKTKTVEVDKHDTTTVTVTQHDTTKIYYQPNLIGTWRAVSTATLAYDQTFDSHFLTQGYLPPFNYLASGDSIYILGLNKVVFANYGYTISKTNDTLIYYYLNGALKPTDTFKRVN